MKNFKGVSPRRRLFRFALYGVASCAFGCLPLNLNAATANVSIVNFAFSPSSVNINVSDSVKWTWAGSPHSTTSDTGLWESGSFSRARLRSETWPTIPIRSRCMISPPAITRSPPLEETVGERMLAVPTHNPLLDYKFTNELSQRVSLSDFRGQALAITFFFTRCPISDYCPRLSKNFQEASNNRFCPLCLK